MDVPRLAIREINVAYVTKGLNVTGVAIIKRKILKIESQELAKYKENLK